MVDSKLRMLVRKLGREVKAALGRKPGNKGIQPVHRRYRSPQDDRTEGYWLAIGGLGKGVRLELWIDHYSGYPSPKIWCGLSSQSPLGVQRIVKQITLNGLHKLPLKRSGRDTTKRPPYRFTRPLSSREFDVLIHEHYPEQRDYLGMFLNYPWPLSGRTSKAVVRDASNLLSKLCAAFEATQSGMKRCMYTPGPWGRPDPRTEKAAVKHVRRYLKEIGYTVRSREQEICGYDLHATKNERELHVEVKGCADAVPRFFISRTELRAAHSDSCWRLTVITNARTRPRTPRLLTNKQIKRRFSIEPTQWEGNLH
jgi:hypothetical protein